MKLLKASVKNFGSYKELEFDYSDLGLALVHGPTGAGKSTLQDIPAWVLFGVTAKDGAVDEVRSWFSPQEPTSGRLEVQLPTGSLTITRVRGKAGQNDLFFEDRGLGGEASRGKDLSETQRLLNARLGLDAEAYLAGAYFHEFSTTANFFSAKRDVRRSLFEGLIDLSPSKLLADKASGARKTARASLGAQQSALDLLGGRLHQLLAQIESAKDDGCDWEKKQAKVIKEAEAKAKSFEADKDEQIEFLITQIEGFDHHIIPMEPLISSIAALQQSLTEIPRDNKCAACGQSSKNGERLVLMAQISELDSKYQANRRLMDRRAGILRDLETVNNSENHWDKQAATECARVNPYRGMEDKARAAREQLETKFHDAKAEVEALGRRVDALMYLQDLACALRAELLKASVQSIEAATNALLEKHFDAELKVAFALEGSDNLQVDIQKSGYPCTFKQLSKGQRQLLKLCFSVAVMRATADKVGAHFDTLMFDEALDGLDSDLKVKAFDLFQELATDHASVLLIDHAPELQNLFTARFAVSLSGDTSKIEAHHGEA